MSVEASFNPAAFLPSAPIKTKFVTLSLPELKSLAMDGLVSMFDAEREMFCYRLRRTPQGMVREGVSRRYTVMALLGLREAQRAGGSCPFPLDEMIEGCFRHTDWICGIGDLGLLTWLMAECAPEQLHDFFRHIDLETCLARFQDAREGSTMELAWFLTGLCSAAFVTPNSSWPLDDLCVQTYHRLQENHHESGLFGHSATKGSLVGFLRGRIGSFADQIYSIYALVNFARAFNVDEPLDAALECAVTICRLQGPLGQWWWRYDAVSGRVLCRYPVFSVEQYGIAPLVLSALEETTGQRFRPHIRRGMDWIAGSNELEQDLRSPSDRLIWSCIGTSTRRRAYWETAVNFIRPLADHTPHGSLRVLHESRPFELGLLLYALLKGGVAAISTDQGSSLSRRHREAQGLEGLGQHE